MVDPYGIAHRRGHWYLVGKTADGERMYRVDRISKLNVGETTQAFTKPRNFDIKAAVDAQPWEAGADPVTTTTVRFDEDVAWWAARSLGIAEPHGELTTEVEVANRDAFIGWILSFGTSTEVLAPNDMREAVAARVRAAVEQMG